MVSAASPCVVFDWRSLDSRFARSCGGEWLGGRHGRKASTMSREHGGPVGPEPPIWNGEHWCRAVSESLSSSGSIDCLLYMRGILAI
jgi:hypothetical protein